MYAQQSKCHAPPNFVLSAQACGRSFLGSLDIGGSLKLRSGCHWKDGEALPIPLSLGLIYFCLLEGMDHIPRVGAVNLVKTSQPAVTPGHMTISHR
jgi:hypothetical protein